MDIEIILEPDLHPNQVAEIAVEAENYGVRALWSSNYHQQWDAFLSLVPAAQKTSKILLGPLAISPFEMHPLKMANALLTLNELSNGRGMLAIGAGGGTLGSMKYSCENDTCYGLKPFRIIRAVKEALEILKSASDKKFNLKYENIYANNFLFDSKDNIIGIDPSNPLSKDQGKVTVANNISGENIIIGDGYTDYEIKKYVAANIFIQFTENINRKNINSKADLISNNFDQIISFIKKNN